MEDEAEQLRQRALAMLRHAYESAANIRRIKLVVLNRACPPGEEYHNIDEVVREWMSRAGAIAGFAVGLGLITPAESRDIIVEFYDAHPEMRHDDGAPLEKPD